MKIFQNKSFLELDYALIIFGSVCSAFAVFSLSFGVLSWAYILILGGALFFLLKIDMPPQYFRVGVGAVLAGVFCKAVVELDAVNLSLAVVLFLVFQATYQRIVGKIVEEKQENTIKEETGEIENEELEDEQLAAKFEFLLEERTRITEALQQSREELAKTAYYDSLTGIPNRAYLIERLDLLIKLGIDIADSYYVLFLDLSRFKNINDSLGHTIGDKLLVAVAQRLTTILPDKNTIARIGGDEFAIILKDFPSLGEAEEYAEQIHQKLSMPYGIDGHKIYINLFIGISPFDIEHLTPEDVLRDADIAMHAAKENNRYVGIFNRELRTEFLERIKLESDLRFAVSRKELVLYYQPLISLSDGTLMGFESLLRWQHPKYGLIPPDKFIPIAEDSNLIISMTEWILKEACRQISEWQSISPEFNKLKINVNLSGKHLADENLLVHIQNALEEAALPPEFLTLELTESSMTENAEQAIKMFGKLREIGVKLSIDDFGTGYSSLSYLHRLPFHSLKIDRSFVSDFKEGKENSQILQTIITLAKNLDLRTVAEGIETVKHLRLLQNLGCDIGQGYLFSKPMPKQEIEELFQQNKNWFPADFVSSDSGSIQYISKDTTQHF